ncbi:hypothetical protein HDU97_000077 [Phlyctochytrium planicorne]|nr:hypothetical protein HDU97_000077 [Phlyctochytrium planicorne]
MATPVASTSLSLRQHKQLADQAYKVLSAALDKDQPGTDPNAVLELYRRGIRDLKSAIKMQFDTVEERRRAEALNVKLQANLDHVEERVKELTSKISSNGKSLSRQPSFSNRPKTAEPPKSTNKTNWKNSNIDHAIANRILNEIVVNGPNVSWTDIVGLDAAKQALREIVILPTLRPELFTGLRSPARGVLLFGPPGTGKTMLAKAVAHESKATFFSVSASTLTSKFDEAALRRLVKRIYIPLPEAQTRLTLIMYLLRDHKHNLSQRDVVKLVQLTDGYSGSDITALAREASMGPIRALGDSLVSAAAEDLRPIILKDFDLAIGTIRPSVSKSSLKTYEEWNKEYGTTGA